MQSGFDQNKNEFFNSKTVLKNINNLIEIGFNQDDIFIISELMYINNIRKFHHFFNNLTNCVTCKPTKIYLPDTNEFVDIYHARIGDKVLSPAAEMFFRFLFGLYNFKKFDSRHIDALFFNKTLSDIAIFTQMVTKCRDTKICQRVFNKINLDLFIQKCLVNMTQIINSYYFYE